MRKNNRTAVLALLLAAGIAAAGCGTNPADEKQDGQTQTDGGTNAGGADTEKDSSAQDKDSASKAEDGESGAKDSGSEEKTEIRREDYPDCDGSGHGYVEIYYSDGTVETEEY